MSAPLLWISHRGLALESDENTLDAFRKAVEAGFDVLETDIRLSRDGHAVLCHDPSFTRCGGGERLVSQMTLDEIVKIKLTKGEQPATLNQLLDEFPDMPLTLDIKPEDGERTIDVVSQMIKQRNLEDRVKNGAIRFLFWKAGHQRQMQELFPIIHCYARADECKAVGLAALTRIDWLIRPRLGLTYSLPPSFKGIDLYRQTFVDRFHKKGSFCLAFLPDSKEEMLRAIAAGFDEILSNHPPLKNAKT